ncbi:MAG: hypothetical protein SGI83_05710 [Bacteroidota bacterium]|nr:hypothetical protein [Bacteroidota bacterium]
MRKISQWAKNYKSSARLTIAVSLLLLGVFGIVTGILLQEIDVAISPSMLLAFAGIYFAAAIAYPVRYSDKKSPVLTSFYQKQKTCDWLLAASTFCMVVYIGNQPGKIAISTMSLQAAIQATISSPKDSTIKTYKAIAGFKASLKDETGKSLKWKEKKKLLKEQISAIKKAGDLSKGAKIALIILSVLVAIGLLYLVAALSCSLSCGGSGVGAVLVSIGGAGLTIFLLLLAIRAITGRKKQPKTTKEPTSPGS